MPIPRPWLLALLIVSFASFIPQIEAQTRPNSKSVSFPVASESEDVSRADMFQFRLASRGETFLSPGNGFDRERSERLNASRERLREYVADGDDGRTCYTMRSYLVVRDDPGSDSTRVARYSTCQPSSRIHLKSAVESGPAVQH